MNKGTHHLLWTLFITNRKYRRSLGWRGPLPPNVAQLKKPRVMSEETRSRRRGRRAK